MSNRSLSRVQPGSPTPALRGILWMIASAFFYAFTFVAIRELASTFSVFQVVLFRAVLGTAVMTPWLMRAGAGALHTSRWRLYGLRAVITYSGMVCWFYGLANLRLADATAIVFTAPVFTVVILAILWREKVGLGLWAAILVGFAGAMIIVRPGLIEISLATAALMWTAVSYGASNAFTRALTTTENANAVVFYMFATVVPLSLYPALDNWTMPGWGDIPMILVFGALSLVSMQCMTRSLLAAPGAVVMPFFYLQLPLVAGLGFVLYGEVSDVWTWVGAAVICASGYYVVRLEGRGRATSK